jgi:tripartite-type tricarboxylate transporter receptor subunit TctC
MRSRAAAFCVSAILIAAMSTAVAQAPSGFPTRPVRFIVPFPGGGSNDVVARIAADKLQEKWGQTIVIENKTGAGGNIGAEFAAQSEPDVHTLLVSPPGPLSINQSLYRRLAYRPEDFVPITLLTSVSNLIVVRPELGIASLADLIDRARRAPGKLSYGSQGNGSTPHLTGSMFMNLTGVMFVHVPYRGENPVVNDMLGGHVDLFFGSIVPVFPLYREGKLKVLAVSDVKRAVQLPEIPTSAEAGLPDFISTSWFALAGPPRMVPALAERIAADFTEVLKLADVQARLQAIGLEPVGGTPAQAAAFVKQEAVRWHEVIVKNDIRVE